ncbi:MAG: iron-sulfur cluster-binding domain-containing protein [Clostridia bacterium]|nr:iron-sulfur cluster-binding domain-containing protein [Clostridia bacterium]
MGLLLNPLKFTKLSKNRQEKIDAAEAKPVKQLGDYLPNRIAKALHPEVQHVVISEIVEHSPDVKSFFFAPDKELGTESLAYFSAGQYLTIRLNVGKAKISRPYSLSSSPKESTEGKYTLTIKRDKDGLASNYVLDNWKVGDKVTVSAPEGVFTYEPLRDASTVIGLAGGSGITPFLSLAKAIADGDEDANLVLLYGSRTADDILFKAEFDALEQKCDKIKVVHVLSGEEKEGFEHGFITADLIKKYAPEGEYSIFICGPQVMYDFVDKEIATLGLRRKFVRHEVFGEYRNPARNEDYPKDVADEFSLTVKIRGEETTIKCSANETILNALEHAGVNAPARCRSGICGYCHSRLVSGEVYVPKSVDGRRMADLDYGYIHPCCTFPISDLVIDVPPETTRI